MKERIWLSPPHLSGNELAFVNEAFQNNWVTSIGENINVFEEQLKNFLGDSREVCALNSATSAIHLALKILGVSAGDEVITSTFSFIASANPIVYCGAKPIFIDSEPETWNMCSESLELAIKSRISKGVKPKAIILVHLYGMPAKMDEILEIAHRYEIPIIEDAAEALGSKYKNKFCSTFGDYGIISFNGNKIITTSGGGALLCHTKDDKEKALFLATQARDEAPHYQHSNTGYNYRMSNILAGLGRAQMNVLEERVEARRRINQFYKNIFKNISGVEVFSEPSSDFFSNHWLTAIIIDASKTGKSSEGLRFALQEENIESRPLWKPLHLQPIFSDSLYFGSNVSEDLFNKGLCLPSGSCLTDFQLERIERVIRNYFLED